MPDSFFDEMPTVMVVYEGETEEKFLFDYYPDEISFEAEEFIGLTQDEAKQLKGKKDREWLRR